MPRLIKRWATQILIPVAVGIHKIQLPWQRLWAHACLAAKIRFPLDISVVVHGCPEVHGTGCLRLGRNICLYRELYFETQEQGQIFIGDEVVISRGVHVVSFHSIHIGVGTMIGEYSSIRDANHRVVTEGLNRHAGHTSAPITIGNNVWIGRGVTVLSGVSIGDNAVIGANAVVTKNIPKNTIAVGIPAHPIKSMTL